MFLAKIARVLEIAPPGYPTTRRPREESFRRPDVVIGTRDWGAVERFLWDMGPNEITGSKETRKQHIRIVLQDGERWYLNLLVSETAQRSRITSTAAAKLGRGSVHDKRLHLRDMNGNEVSFTVDVVDTSRELLAGRVLASRGAQTSHGADAGGRAAHPGDDAHRMDGEDRPSQGMGQPGEKEGSALPGGPRKRSRGAGVFQASQSEGRGGGMLRVTALFDKSVPNTVIRYGAAMVLDL